ncbi:hypothetical protein AX15_001857 [Amanita polypyramis BW_CC]|nr:hypothetical protein AX15_001857 [Amanita polypyramis BW_CC]
MRRAAISAGLVTNETEALSRISFVTEGEASHFCLEKISNAREDHTNDGIMVVDCGGGTIDVSTYVRSSGSKFKEIAAAECLLQGSIFVSHRAQAYLIDKLLKPIFKEPSMSYRIPTGGKETHPDLDIKLGNLTIHGPEIAEFFEPSVLGIIHIIENRYQMLTSVAEGSVSFSIDHFVTTRVSRYTYGVEFNPVFKKSNPERVTRAHMCYVNLSGFRQVPNGFATILPRDTAVSEDKEFRRSFVSEYTQAEFDALPTKKFMIRCYRDREAKTPAWLDMTPELFGNLCVVSANLSRVKKSIEGQTNRKTGVVYYRLCYDIVLLSSDCLDGRWR